jgi:PKD repeat protein
MRAAGGIAVALLFLTGALIVGAASVSGRPACAFSVNVIASPEGGAVPLVVEFNATTSAGVPSQYNWTFGDGSLWSSGSPGASHPYHRYSAPGTYSAVVDVQEAGCSGSASTNVTAVAGPLSLVIVEHPSSGSAPLTVQFNASVAGGTGTYLTAAWNFGDGDVGSGLGVRYTYKKPGRYTVVVNVTDSGGHEAVQSARVQVTNPPSAGSGSTELDLAAAGIAVALLVTGAWGIWRRRRHQESMDGPPATGAIASSPPSGPAEPLPATATSNSPLSPPLPPRSAPGPSSISETPSPGRERARLSERVILHLGGQPAVDADGVGTLPRTQGGMATGLGVGQNSLTNVLRRLEAAGVVRTQLRHVRGSPRRLKVYELTPRGESLYRERRSNPPSAGAVPPTSD